MDTAQLNHYYEMEHIIRTSDDYEHSIRRVYRYLDTALHLHGLPAANYISGFVSWLDAMKYDNY